MMVFAAPVSVSSHDIRADRRETGSVVPEFGQGRAVTDSIAPIMRPIDDASPRLTAEVARNGRR